METKRMIGKSLQPARPARHLSAHERLLEWEGVPNSVTKNGSTNLLIPAASVSPASASTFSFEAEFPCSTPICVPDEITWMCKSNGVQMLNETQIRNHSQQHKPEGTTERITYSRDVLLKLSEVSLAQKKPEFLPDHPIVLEKPKNYHLLPIARNDRSF